MNDSDLDFVDLCSKLLKRVRKKPDDSRQPRKDEPRSSSQTGGGDTGSRRKQKNQTGDKFAASQPAGNRGEQNQLSGPEAGEAASSWAVSGGQRAKDKVLDRMQQFRRDSPQKMLKDQPTRNHEETAPPSSSSSSSFTQHQRGDIQPFSSDLQEAPPEESDEALALRLQQELDKESAQAQIVDLEDGGLFFCQICHKDLSHMTPEGRTQHLNRCLDESEGSAPAPGLAPAPAPGVPDCPICGKKFKSQKSRSAHLKRCSSEMGISPAVLLQALQRQAEEGQSAAVSSANTSTQTLGTKRKAPPKPGVPVKKKPRTKPHPLDEETLVALALSSSLQEQERERWGGQEAEILLHSESAASHRNPALKWQQEAGRGRGKRKRGGVPRPPPLLLVQDAEAALTRLQERVSALLLRSRAPSPPTPTRCPSTLPAQEGAAPLWRKSSLQDGAPGSPSEYYSPELREFFTSCGAAAINTRLDNKPESSIQRAREETPSSGTKEIIQPPPSTTPPTAPPTPGSGQLLVGSQALQDLMELAEDGMTLTQWRYDGKGQQVGAGQAANLRLSGFVQEEEEEEDEGDLCASGFLPETVPRHSAAQRRATGRSHGSESLSRLASDLSSMVNNPQLSDVQLQVDSGDVFFAHSFMVYARCPLLAEMVHESGFEVQEEGLPAARRVLVSDVPDQAALALLQYLYTGRCSVTASLQPHVLELASRFDLQELQQLCQLLQEEAGHVDQQENDQTDQAFMELLRSMWVEGEEEEDEGADSDGGRSDEGRRVEEDRQADEEAADDRETSEEQVNEKELEEIYEFAATQRRREEEEEDSEEEEEEQRQDDDGESKPSEPKRGLDDEKLLQRDSRLHPSLDRSYDRLFSGSFGVYEDGDSGTAKTRPPQPEQSLNKRSPQLSCRALLQSSLDNLSLSPPPSSSNLPVPGLSPLQLDSRRRGDEREDDVELDRPAKRESSGPRSICVPPSPQCPKQPPEPELIVLSDSSEDVEVDAAVLSPSPPSPRIANEPQSHTEIASRRTDKEPGRVTWSPGDPPDCSPEVSWLIPSTPLQPGRSTTSSSTQTRSSMCRTKLFPVETSPPPSAVFSSPASPPHTSGLRKDADLFAPPLTKRPHLSSLTNSSSFTQNTPLHLQAPPHSSTPLHTEHQKPPALLPPASPLHSDPGEAGGRRNESLESLRLSPSSSCRLQSSDRRSESNRRAAEARGGGDDGEATEKRVEDTGRATDVGDPGDGETNEEAESSFQLSFAALDEPPLAFNDSWGLDAGADEPPGGFSLRLEASGPSSSSSSSSNPAPSSRTGASVKSHGGLATPPPPEVTRLQSPKPRPSFRPSPPDPTTRTPAEFDKDLLDSKIWDSWEEEEEEEEEVLPLSQRLNPSAQMKTPTMSRSKPRPPLAPVTPMPHYSDMDTPELKNKLNRFGVRPLPKRQMVLKLKEIHQYTHQLASSDSEDEAQRKPRPAGPGEFREPQAPPPLTRHGEEEEEEKEEEEDGEEEPLSASQGSNTSSTAASEESERSNPELCVSSEGDSDSDGAGVSSSQAASRLQDRLLAVRSFILSDAELYSRILHYEPLVLSQLQQQLKAAGIRLGAAKLIDYLDSQCITFTTAGRGRRRGRGGAKAAARGGVRRRKRGGSTMI